MAVVIFLCPLLSMIEFVPVSSCSKRFYRPTTITIVHHSVVRGTQFAFVMLFPIFAAAVSGGVL